MRSPEKMLQKGQMTLMTGLIVTVVGIGLYCIGQALGTVSGPANLTSETGAAIIVIGVRIWLKGAVTLSLEL